MTLVATIGFPEEVFIIGDSRASYPNSSIPPRDELKKVYQLSPYLCLAYTTDDVKFTFKLIESITIFASKNNQLKAHILLKKVTEFSKKEYLVISNALNKKPSIQIIYAGISDQPLRENRNKIKRLISIYKNESHFPEKVKQLNLNGSSKYVQIPPPTPLLVKQRFPEGRVSSTKGWDFTALGSGGKIQDEFEKYYRKLFFFPGGFNKGIILNDLCNEFISRSNVNSIGGIVQIFMINKDGVIPIIFEESSDGVVKRRIYIDQNGDWVEEKNGQILKSTQNPPKL